MEKVSDYSTQAGNLNDEIDLKLLGLRIINALQRSFKIVVGFTVLGVLLGVFYYNTTKPVYKTSLIASSKVLTNIRVTSLIQVLDDLAKENNAIQLARKMQISPSLAGEIKRIESKSILSEKNVGEKVSELDNNVFEITLSTFDNKRFDSLQAGILHYLQNNNFVEKRIAIQKQNLEKMRERVREEVKKLDSLRFSVNRLLSKGVGNNSTMLISDPASVNKDIIALYEKELNINSELQLIDDIQVIQDFTQYEKPSSPQLINSIAVSTSSAIALALILIAILESSRVMRKMKQELEQKVKNEKKFV